MLVWFSEGMSMVYEQLGLGVADVADGTLPRLLVRKRRRGDWHTLCGGAWPAPMEALLGGDTVA